MRYRQAQSDSAAATTAGLLLHGAGLPAKSSIGRPQGSAPHQAEQPAAAVAAKHSTHVGLQDSHLVAAADSGRTEQQQQQQQLKADRPGPTAAQTAQQPAAAAVAAAAASEQPRVGQVLRARPSRSQTQLQQQQTGGHQGAKPAQALTTHKLTGAKRKAATAAGAGSARQLRRQRACDDPALADETADADAGADAAADAAEAETEKGQQQQQQQGGRQQQSRSQPQAARVRLAFLADLTKQQQRLLLQQGGLVAHWKEGGCVS